MLTVRVATITLLSTAFLVTAGCARLVVEPTSPEREAARWIATPRTPARGAVLIAHGLNLRPSAMDELGRSLADAGFHSYRLALRGHVSEEGDVFPAQSWRDDILTGYSLVRTTYPTLPLHILAFSAGGLLATDLIARNPEVRPSSMVLLAPALSLHTYVRIASILTIFPPLTWRVRNLAPAGYRRFTTTPLFWYTNVLDSYDDTRSIPHPEPLRDIPTRVFVSADDELVSESGIVEWIGEHGLEGSWQVVEITPKPQNESSFDHLIIDKASLGEVAWQRMLDSIVELFLQQGEGAEQ